jgi:hypothetical protein
LEIGAVASCESSDPLLAATDAFGVTERKREDLLVAIDSSITLIRDFSMRKLIRCTLPYTRKKIIIKYQRSKQTVLLSDHMIPRLLLLTEGRQAIRNKNQQLSKILKNVTLL